MLITYHRSDDLLSTTAGRDAFLDQEVQELQSDSWVVLTEGDHAFVYAITATSGGSRADFAISAKTTGVDLASLAPPPSKGSPASPSVQLDGVWLYSPPRKPNWLRLRKTQAYVGATQQTLASMPYAEPVERITLGGFRYVLLRRRVTGATWLTLDRMVLGLAKGQAVMISGTEAGDSLRPSTGVARSEVAILDKITHAGGRTTLYFTQALAYRYVRSTCVVNANVVLATHGESVAPEILGSGDGALANQRFVLRKTPLTYVSAANARGAESTLEVRVNGVLWNEVPSLYDQSPRSQSYVVRLGEDGTATVEFGDGERGARLPTGQENVVARYRAGIGKAGNVRARSLSLLLNPPLGVRSAVNPIAASGGADPEQLANARQNAPLALLTLDRIVSLQDFEDFARGFAGVGKVHAEAIWSGDRRVVYLSVADASGKELEPDLPLFMSLSQALETLSDGGDEIAIGGVDPTSLVLRTFTDRRFQIEATVGIDPRYDSDVVKAAVIDTIASTFSFEQRSLAQHVTEAEAIVAIQGVPGVVYAQLIRLGDQQLPALPDGGVLVASSAHWDPSGTWIQPADLLTVSPTGITIHTVAP